MKLNQAPGKKKKIPVGELKTDDKKIGCRSKSTLLPSLLSSVWHYRLVPPQKIIDNLFTKSEGASNTWGHSPDPNPSQSAEFICLLPYRHAN